MGRPAKALISREGAAKAALAVIDDSGLEALSVELIARRLGVKAPSLYHHFGDKAELLAEVARLLLVDIRPQLKAARSWRDQAIALCVATRRRILEHPHAAPLLLQFFPRHLLLGAYDHWVAQFPLPLEQRFVLLDGLEKYTFGSSLFEAACHSRGIPAMPRLDAARHPNLAQAMNAAGLSTEQVFVATLTRMIIGFEQLPAADVAAAAKPRSRRVAPPRKTAPAAKKTAKPAAPRAARPNRGR